MTDLIGPFLSTVVIQEYEGELEDGLSHGFGKATFRSGSQYTGNFNRGQMHGQGIYDWSDGVTYEGDFKDNKITGSGTYLWYIYLILKRLANSNSYIGEIRDSSTRVKFKMD